jgi:hypothetical protein
MGKVLLQRRAEGEPWQFLPPESPVFTGDTLVSWPGYQSEIRLDSGVRLELLGALPEPNPTSKVILESAVVLHAAPTPDLLDFTLRDGRVRLTSLKPEGPARARIRFHDQVWDLTLQDNQAEVVLQLWGDDPVGPGAGGDKGPGPIAVMDLFVFKGQIQVNDGLHERILPGPCAFYWHSVYGVAPRPVFSPWPPSFAAQSLTLKQPFRQALEKLSLAMLKKKAAVDADLVAALNEPEPSNLLAVFCLGAIDDVPHLLDALSDPRHRDVRGTAAFALKHWLHRERGQDQKLAAALLAKYQDQKLAEPVFWLLHSFSEQDRAKPETYQLLLEYLNHEQLPVRELAFEKLTQLAPQAAKEVAKEAPYDPAGTPEQRAKAYQSWKNKIPEGQVPPAPERPR